jgi:hypothetical protein
MRTGRSCVRYRSTTPGATHSDWLSGPGRPGAALLHRLGEADVQAVQALVARAHRPAGRALAPQTTTAFAVSAYSSIWSKFM